MRTSPLCLAILALLAAGRAAAGEADPAQVLIQTSMGDIMLELDRVHAPATVDNFIRYVSEGHFDGTAVYRVVPGFVVQMGSYDAEMHARPVHDPIVLEANNGLTNVRGSVAMAREVEPSTATAEFFIDLVDNPALDRKPDAANGANSTGYAVFGHVVSGMDVVDKIASVPLGDHGPMPGTAPVTPVIVRDVKLLP